MRKQSFWRQSITALLAAAAYTISFPATAETLSRGASIHNANWVVEGSIFNCNLRQNLEGYGTFDFNHRAGESLVFSLRINDNTLAPGEAEFISAPPPWRSSEPSLLLATPLVRAGNTALEVEYPLSRRLLSELDIGRVPTLRAPSILDPKRTISIGLSPVRFSPAFASYKRCVADLLPVNFSQIAKSSLHWASGSIELTAAAKETLDKIVLYSAADPRVYGYEVDSFTDTAGERLENLRISEVRAQLVTQYLVNAGIDAERIATRAHGEREEYLLVRAERDAADRDRNRRVNIVLLRR